MTNTEEETDHGADCDVRVMKGSLKGELPDFED